jgi:hypothetical protein
MGLITPETVTISPSAIVELETEQVKELEILVIVRVIEDVSEISSSSITVREIVYVPV